MCIHGGNINKIKLYDDQVYTGLTANLIIKYLDNAIQSKYIGI